MSNLKRVIVLVILSKASVFLKDKTVNISIRRRMQCASMSNSIGLPVISFQVGWSGCFHKKMLYIPPCQQKAAENKDTTSLTWPNRAANYLYPC